jgi:hypothetical protein
MLSQPLELMFPNALDLRWQSMSNGGSDVQLNVYQWRGATRRSTGQATAYSCGFWSEEAIASANLHRIALIDLGRGHTAQMPLGAFTTELKGSVGHACECHWHALRAAR